MTTLSVSHRSLYLLLVVGSHRASLTGKPFACHNVVGPLEIQATFSCIDAITSVPDQNDRLETRNLVVTALLVIQLITTRSHLDTEMTVAIQSVMKVLLRVVSGEDNDYLDALNEART
ncbi:hypothetical protein GQ600_24761 [Phytophthora cactorum]|nr:hypothetical protein GQ600_24761 [Phytophthora cactorum]